MTSWVWLGIYDTAVLSSPDQTQYLYFTWCSIPCWFIKEFYCYNMSFARLTLAHHISPGNTNKIRLHLWGHLFVIMISLISEDILKSISAVYISYIYNSWLTFYHNRHMVLGLFIYGLINISICLDVFFITLCDNAI